MKKYAVIVAAGKGIRMGTEMPKQFLILHEKPLLSYTLQSFFSAFKDLQVILVLPADHIDLGNEMIDAFFSTKKITVVAGGATRFQSVKIGLSCIHEESIIFVHDGVRCLVSKELIWRCYEKALSTGSAIPAISSTDSVRLVTEDGNETIDRKKIKIIQTPQTFHSKILLPAFQIDEKEQFTDEATVVEAFGMKVNLVEGEERNFKITKREDLLLAEQLLKD